MKLGRLIDGRFQIALAKLITQPMPLRAAFKLKGINAKVQAETQKYEEVRQAALKRYGDKDEKGELLLNEDQTVKFSSDNFQAFATELNELSDTDVEVGAISITELGEKVQLTGDEVIALDSLLTE